MTTTDELTFAEKDDETLTVLLDGEPVGSVTWDEVFDAYRVRKQTRFFPSIAGEPIGLNRGYATPEAAAHKIKAKTTYLRRSA